uniref:DEAD/SNF2-like helicase n=1 Tax=Marseillevirus LCMAC102 TaxID=2506603 RepID=A0A481YVQ5_9VIRU|nr:MAG: DEAD/SNF2-like helicase [Marseillevirus LCMAC102]
MSTSDIAQFIPSYPPISDPNFGYEIARRKEFYDLKLPSAELVPKQPGTPLLHQELQARFFSPETDYSEVLLFHGLGTGKTCTSSLIVEHFKSTLVDSKPRKPALVIVPSEDLERNYRKDVAEVCTREIYLPSHTSVELMKQKKVGAVMKMTDLAYEKRLRLAIGKTYEIVTVQKFLTHLPRNEIIKQKYSNRLIIIDEAHDLRIQPKKKKKKVFAEEKAGITIEMYGQMHRFLHTVENCRKILLTGTPIWDQAYEIASIMNLILPKDEQLPTRTDFMKNFFDDEGNLISSSEELLRTRFRGRISFLRSMTTTAQREEIGVKAPWLKYVSVFPSAMSQFQYQYAQEALKVTKVIKVKYRSKTGTLITSEREVKGGAVRVLARDASSFVFPVFMVKQGTSRVIGGEYGKPAFQKYIELRGQKYRYKDSKITEEIKKNIAKYSSKFAAVLDFIKKYPKELVFIYDEFVTGGGGAINLGLVLEQHGFLWARTAADIRTPDKQGRKRFAVITSDPGTTHKSKQIQDILASFNNSDNMYGERCQIIIGSEKIGLGLTIKNVRQAHIMMGHWNISAIEQALGRIYRIGSHDALPNEQRHIKIFRHIAAKEYDKDKDTKEYNKNKGYPSDVGFSKKETMDLIVYRIAETKEYPKTQIYRLLQKIAWDCVLNYERNVLEGDQNNSRACNYQECNYRCDNFPEEYINKSSRVWKYNIPEKDLLKDTYNLIYASDDISKMITKLVNLFGVYFNLRLDIISNLIDITSIEEHKLLLRALDFIIDSRVRIQNRYGFENYLKEQGNIYFLDNTISVFSNYPEVTYIINPLITERTTLQILVEITKLQQDKHLVIKFCLAAKENANVLNKIHYQTIIILLEKVQELRRKTLTLKEKEVIDVFITKLGRNLVEMVDGKIVHNMYASDYTGLGYSVIIKDLKPTGLLRVFDPKTGKWNYVVAENEKMYIDYLIKLQKATPEIVWDKNPYGVYGFRDVDGKFKIRVKPLPGKKETRGAVCTQAAWSVPRLIDLFISLEYLPPVGVEYQNFSRAQLLQDIRAQPGLTNFLYNLDKKTDKELRQILTIHSMDKIQMCNSLEKWFKQNNLFEDYRT